jgi:integrase
MVGATGFEPATSSSRTKRATKLRYAPTCLKQVTCVTILGSVVSRCPVILSGVRCDVSASQKKSAAFEKVGECLYRLASTGGYYARVWLRGKEIRRSLKTKDRELAKRRLRDLRRELEQIDSDAARLTLTDLLTSYLATSQHKSKSSSDKAEAIAKRIRSEWPGGGSIKVRDVKPSTVLQWLKKQRERYASSTYNECVQFVRRMFDMAVKDRVILASPAADIKQAKRETPIRDTPTWEEFRAIVADIRAQKLNADSKDSGDAAELMGLAGLGNAEAKGLTWGDIDFKNGRIRVYRQKTDTGFSIPIYPQLRPLLNSLQGPMKRVADEPILKVTDIRKALAGACQRLKLPHYTARSLRRCFITRAVELGIDFKTIAAMQGHKDGGVLIAKTYSHLRNEHMENMAAKLTEQ